MPSDNDILTIEGAAEYLKMSVLTIRKLLKDGDLPARMVRNKWRFSKRELLEWVEKKTNGKEADHGKD